MRMFVIALSLLPAQAALAALITIGFEGPVELREDVAPWGGDWPIDELDLLPPIVPGDRFHGSFTFDDSAPDLDDDGPFRGFYRLDNLASTRAQVEINGSTFALEEPPVPFEAVVEILNFQTIDSWVFEWREYVSDAVLDDFFTVHLTSSSIGGPIPPEYDFIAGDRLFGTTDFSRFQFGNFHYVAQAQLVFGPSGAEQILSAFGGPITALRVVSVVPEPKPIALLVALATIAFRRTMLLRNGTASTSRRPRRAA